MKYKEFIADLNKEKHVYLLAGAEEYYIDKAREAILSKIFPNGEGRADGLIKLDCDKKIDINQIIGALETTPFFSEKNIILVKNTTLFKGKSKSEEESDAPKKDLTTEKLIKVLSDMLETNYVIFTTRDDPDKRKKLYKTVVKFGSVLEAEALRPWQINEWLNEENLKKEENDFNKDYLKICNFEKDYNDLIYS